MEPVVRQELARKAPLVDPDQLVELVEHKLLAEELRAHADSLWLRGSFVDPDREIDTGEKYSDLDVFVAVPGWDPPPAGPGTVIYAPQTDLVMSEAVAEDGYDWTYAHQWESAERAYERLPEYARETFVQSLEHFFHASEQDRDEEVYRQYDVRIGNPDHVDLFPFASKVKDL